MPGSIETGGLLNYQLQPSAQQITTSTNYINNFDFLSTYLPDTYEKEFERYGNRTVSSFLRMVGAEMPSNSDKVIWAEQGRLHVKYTGVTSGAAAAQDTATWTVPAAQIIPATQPQTGAAGGIAIRVGHTVMFSDSTPGSTFTNKAVVTAVDYPNRTFDVAYYEAGGQTMAAAVDCDVFIYGSEFKKGQVGMPETLISDDSIFSNSPIILKDTYKVNGSDMAQIGWIEISGEDGANGYLWYLKSEHDTRLRFDDYLETAMVEAVPAEAASGAIANAAGIAGNKGSEGIFHVVGTRGNVWSGGNPTVLADFDAIIERLDKQGSIEENVLFLNRQFGFDIDDMLASQNSYGNGGSSYGLFDNDEEMALNLGFRGFLVGGAINGLMVPAGSTTVYDQILGRNAKRPFLHVRYRASETEDRRYKTWITGGAGGAATSDVDVMSVNFLSERCVCTMGANNFFLFKA